MLYIWMPEAQGTWHWSVGEQWNCAETLDVLIREIEQQAQQECIVFFPSRDVQLLNTELTKSQYQKLGSVGAQYILEEFLIHPIDQYQVLQHFQMPNQLNLLGMAQHQLDTYKHVLNLLHVPCVALLPDFMLLPTPEAGQTVMVAMAGRTLARESEFIGHSVDDLSLYMQYQVEEKKYVLSGFDAEQLQKLNASHVESFQYLFSPPKRLKQHAWNILPKPKTTPAMSGYLKACVWVFMALLLVQFSYDALRWVNNKQIANVTAQQAIEQYQSWFGAEGRVTEQNIKSQFESRLRASGAADIQAMQLLSRLGPVMMQNQIVAHSVMYENKALNLQLNATSAEALQRLTEQLKQQGMQVQLGSVQTQGGIVQGQVSLQ